MSLASAQYASLRVHVYTLAVHYARDFHVYIVPYVISAYILFTSHLSLRSLKPNARPYTGNIRSTCILLLEIQYTCIWIAH